MKQKRKLDTKEILVIVAMVFFALLIILPPVLQLATAGKEEGPAPIPEDKVEVLTCNKTDPFETYQFIRTFKTYYKNDAVSKVVFTYTQKANVEGETLPSLDEEILKEIDIIGIIPGVEENSEGTTITLTLTEDTLLANVSNPTLTNYKQLIAIQKSYYENLEMKCNIMGNNQP